MSNFQNQNLNNSSATANNQQNNQANQNQQPPSMMMKLVSACLPTIIEQFTGQSISGGNSTETQLVLSQVLSIQQQILTTQQSLEQRLAQLEKNAVQQFTNLVQQVQSIKSIRLSHSKETKAIDYGLETDQN